MHTILCPVLEFTIIIPGMLLAYLPVSSYLKNSPARLASWLLPLLLGICILSGLVCFRSNLPTVVLLPLVLCFIMFIYHKTLSISLWKSGNIFLAVCAVFTCLHSLTRAFQSALLHFSGENKLWFLPDAGIFYNVLCILFVFIAWYPASHTVKAMIEYENMVQTWYVFWILPVAFIGLNLLIKSDIPLHSEQDCQIYTAISLALLIILALFYTLFFLMANMLYQNAKLQQENHLLSIQQECYKSLSTSIEDARQARHDIRHHFLQLSSMVENGQIEKLKEYLNNAIYKIPCLDFHFCENEVADRVIGYYYALAQKEEIPFFVQADLPSSLSVDETDLGLVLSNLLENAFEASQRTEKSRQKICLEIYMHFSTFLLIKVENAFDGNIQKKNYRFLSSKRNAEGIGIQSVRRIAEKTGGSSSFSYENGVFTARVMLRLHQFII